MSSTVALREGGRKRTILLNAKNMKTLSLVIPAYNEEKRLDNTFQELKKLRLPRGLRLAEVIFVNDGSTDKTVACIKAFQKQTKKKLSTKLISYKPNMGKGFAVRQGMLSARGDYAILCDADMSTPLSQIERFAPFMQKNVPIIVGTRKNGKSTVIKHQPRYREFLGKGFTKLAQVVLQSKTTDFTCGFKAFNTTAREAIFPLARINGWGYDAESVFIAQKHGFFLQEVPVVWSNDARTKVHVGKAIFTSLMELAHIRLNATRGCYTTRQTAPILATIQ